MELRDYINILLRHKLLVFGLLVVSLLGASYLMQKEEPIYACSTSLQVNLPKEFIFLQTESIANLKVLTFKTIASLLSTKEYYTNWSQVAQKDGLSYDANALSNMISWEEAEDEDMIRLTVKTPHVDHAPRLLSAAVDAFKERIKERAKSEITENLANLDDFKNKVADQIRQADERLADYRKRNEVYNIENELDNAYSILLSLNEQLDAHITEMQNHKSRIDKLESMIADGQWGDFAVQESPRTLDIYNRIQDLRLQINELSLKYTEDNPTMITLNDQLMHLERQLVESRQQDKEWTGAKLRREAIDEKNFHIKQHATEQQLVQDLKQRVKQKQEEINSLSGKQEGFIRESRNRDGLLSVYQMAEKRASELNVQMTYERQYLDEIQSLNMRTATLLESRRTGLLLISLILGLAVAGGAAYLLELLDTHVKTEFDVKRYLNLPILAQVYKQGKNEHKLINRMKPDDPFAEIFNSMSVVLDNSFLKHGKKAFMVTSADQYEGKSTISTNLAIAFARNQRRTLLIDGDLRLGALNKSFDLHNNGITDMMPAMDKHQQPLELMMQETSENNLFLVPAGPNTQNPVGLLRSKAFEDLIHEARQQFDVIIIDSPPINITADGLVLGGLTDMTIMVNSTEDSNRKNVVYSKHLLQNSGVAIAGIVLNKVKHGQFSQYYKYRYSRYYRVKPM